MSTIASERVRGGMGSLPHESGVAFRVWAPHAEAVYVTGSFNNWSPGAHPMAQEEDGYWYADLADAGFAGNVALAAEQRLERINAS